MTSVAAYYVIITSNRMDRAAAEHREFVAPRRSITDRVRAIGALVTRRPDRSAASA